ncbi:hypothetical protein [Alteribacter natronophilus]|uniref:hypothetical protein n=1 Tax=Alteribacter natronophilus TaxID=2583810 RepID=UPI00110E902C|nr:hypothetical protein [Alteribacter natronophilus]TMW70525.1 hypothetical protein FGB90_15145 [Alteribacter natronophilus]
MMKQILPLILIAALIAGAIFFFQDPMEDGATEERHWERTITSETGADAWDITVFLAQGEEGADIGVDLEYNLEPRELEQFEFILTIADPVNGFFIQETVTEDFDGVFEYQERCKFCEDPERFERQNLPINIQLTWSEGGQVTGNSYGGKTIPVREIIDLEQNGQ